MIHCNLKRQKYLKSVSEVILPNDNTSTLDVLSDYRFLLIIYPELGTMKSILHCSFKFDTTYETQTNNINRLTKLLLYYYCLDSSESDFIWVSHIAA